MKKNIILSIVVFCMFLMACKKDNTSKMLVIKDCTGTYLRFENKDYHVCNIDKVARFENNIKVNARFRKLTECEKEAGKTICQMYHENEGWIEVLEIDKN